MSEVHDVPKDAADVSVAKADLASRLAARICHDLTNPLGAIANGVELLILSGTERSPEIDLISESVESANARLRFFRLAYGTAGQQLIGRSEVVRILTSLSRAGRHTYEWTVEGEIPRDEVKAVFLLFQCLEPVLPLGGQLCAEHDCGTWVVSATGPRLRPDLPAWRTFRSAGMTVPEDAADVQFALLANSLRGLGRPLALDTSADRFEARF